jgi:putative ABC transport system permease protein
MRGKRALDTLDEEIRDHIEREIQDNIDRGLSPGDARRQAMLKFGNVALTKENTRAVWVSLWLEQLLQDVRYTVRTLRRNPGFGTIVILTLALGIGMNTAVFSVFNAVVLRPVAYPNPERLMWLSTTGVEGDPPIVLGPDFVDWREQAGSFDRMVAYGNGDHTLETTNGATRVRLADVTEDFWDVSGARPATGRLPQPGERSVLVLSHAVAQRWFRGDPDVIGRTVTLDGRQVTIVGVLPEDFRFHFPGQPWPGFRPREVDAYQPLYISPVREAQIGLFNVIGRLKPGVTLEQARAEIEAIRTRIAQTHPNPYVFENYRTLRVVSLHDQLVGDAGRALSVLMVAVAFVLLIACANAATLLLARASTRHKEIAIRASVGAGRARVLRQCVVESLVLALLGSAAGLLLARLGVTRILHLDPQAVPRLAESTIDGRVLAVALCLAILTALVFGVAPALALWKVNPNDALKDAARSVSPHAGSLSARRLIVVAQIALALVLLIGAGLMLKSVWRLHAYPAGFEPARVLTMKLEFTRDLGPEQQFAFIDALLRALRSEPGVQAASISTHGYLLTRDLLVEDTPEPSPEDLARQGPIMINSTSAALVRVMGLRMVRGRWITDDEPTAVVNESLARREFREQDPIGRRIQLDAQGPFLTIVGIVADLRYSKLDAAPEPEVYVPYSQGGGLFGFIALIRGTGNPLALAPAIRTLISNVDKTQVPEDVMTLEQALADSIASRRWVLFLLGTFAAAALVLALIGIYGLMAYMVTQRVHEIGVRMALGAQRLEVVRMVVREGMAVTLAGIVAGVVGAVALTGLMSSLLYNVRPTDPQTFTVVPVALATTALLACCVPALKAAFVDPAIALRYE